MAPGRRAGRARGASAPPAARGSEGGWESVSADVASGGAWERVDAPAGADVSAAGSASASVNCAHGHRRRGRHGRRGSVEGMENLSVKGRRKPLPYWDRAMRRLERVAAAGGRGFATGAALRGGIVALRLLVGIRNKGGNKPGAVRQGVVETLRYGAFLGVLSGGYIGIDETLSKSYGDNQSRSWRHALAGLLVGPSLLLAGGNGRSDAKGHMSLATYVLVRALVLLVRCGVKDTRPRTQKILRAIGAEYEHSDVVLLCATASHLLATFIAVPHTLDGGYLNFLKKHGGRTPETMRALRHTVLGKDDKSSVDIKALVGPYAKEYGAAAGKAMASIAPVSVARAGVRIARILDPLGNPARYYVRTWIAEYRRALPMYLAVYITTSVVVQRRRWLAEPAKLTRLNAVGIARSSAFLASYVANAFTVSGILFEMCGTALPDRLHGLPANLFTLLLGTSTGGLAGLFEAKSRRLELALFCAAKAAEALTTQISELSSGRCLQNARFIERPRPPPSKRLSSMFAALTRMDTVMFSIATGTLFHCYEQGEHALHQGLAFPGDACAVTPWSRGGVDERLRVARLCVHSLLTCS